jgi:hypothetical protein
MTEIAGGSAESGERKRSFSSLRSLVWSPVVSQACTTIGVRLIAAVLATGGRGVVA